MANKKKLEWTPQVPGEIEYDIDLTEEEVTFIKWYCIKPNVAYAYRKTHPECKQRMELAWKRGTNLYNRPHVRKEIDAAQSAVAITKDLRTDETLMEVKAIAFSDPIDLFDEKGQPLPLHEIPFEVRKVIKGFKLRSTKTETISSGKKTKKVTYEILEYIPYDKIDALQIICKHLGINKEIPPLEALMNLLPKNVAEKLRKLLAGEVVKSQEQRKEPEEKKNGPAASSAQQEDGVRQNSGHGDGVCEPGGTGGLEEVD